MWQVIRRDPARTTLTTWTASLEIDAGLGTRTAIEQAVHVRECGLTSSPESVVQRQLEAYNARDLPRFLAEYSDDIRAWRPPDPRPALCGKEAFGSFYATQRFNCAALHAELVNRIVVENKVIDHERITGVREEPFEAAVVYQVVDGLICCTWSFTSDQEVQVRTTTHRSA